MTTALVVPVMKNFKGFTQLIQSVREPIVPIVLNNWDANYGVSKAWNVGLNEAARLGHEFAVVVNDDVIFKLDKTLSALTDLLVGDTVLVSPKNTTGLMHPRGLNFWCFAVRPKEFLERFGFFDEAFSPAYFEDDDMAYRIRLAGGQILNTTIPAYHQVMGTQSLSDEPVVPPEVWARNEAYYAEKWGGPGGQEKFVTAFNR